MKYIKENGTNKHLIITLHGTGGRADDLFQIANFLDPHATKVGFQGEVSENGMSRYFARYAEGGFDLDSLKKATDDLDASISRLIKEFKLENHTITIIGYSNGANLAKNLLKEYENTAIDYAILFHPSLITPKIPYKKQTIQVLATFGSNDPYVSEREFMHLKESMMDASISIETYSHNHGHQLTQGELDYAKTFILSKGLTTHGND